jgi:lipopolysaccharide transport system ATP-binding protein
MGQVARQGRTVLFVSHNMPAIKSLCQSGIVLSAGELGYYGPVDQAIERYMAGNDNISTGVVDLSMNKHRFGSGEMRIRKFWVEDETHQPVSELTSGAYCRLAIEYETDGALQRRNVSMSILINTLSGAPVSLVNTDMMDQHFDVAPPEGRIYYVIQRLPLTAGRYIVDLNLATYGGHTYADFIKEAAAFDVIDGDFFGTGRPGNPGAPVMVDGTWTIQGIT